MFGWLTRWWTGESKSTYLERKALKRILADMQNTEYGLYMDSDDWPLKADEMSNVGKLLGMHKDEPLMCVVFAYPDDTWQAMVSRNPASLASLIEHDYLPELIRLGESAEVIANVRAGVAEIRRQYQQPDNAA